MTSIHLEADAAHRRASLQSAARRTRPVPAARRYARRGAPATVRAQHVAAIAAYEDSTYAGPL
jgi:hypothetical protein